MLVLSSSFFCVFLDLFDAFSRAFPATSGASALQLSSARYHLDAPSVSSDAGSFLDAFLFLFFFATLAFALDAAFLCAVPSIAFLAFFFTRLRWTTGRNIHANFFITGSFVTFGKAPLVTRVTRVA